MDITITIKAPEIVDAIHRFADALDHMASAFDGKTFKTGEARYDFQESKQEAAAAVEPEKAQETPAAVPAAAPAAAPASISLEHVRGRLAEISKAGHKEEVKQLLAKFGNGATKLTEVPVDQYPALLAAAEAL